MSTKSLKNQFVVVWRSGGTLNFKWHHTLPGTREEMDEQSASIRLGGRVAHLVNAHLSAQIGLPETYEYVPGQLG